MKEKLSRLKKRASQLPLLSGVYLMKKSEDEILYVGKAKSLKSRVKSYFNAKSSSSLKTTFLLKQIERIDYIVTNNEVEAFLLEANLIKKHKPRYNIRLKDDKAYPYIRLSIQDDFPRFYFERRVKETSDIYFGPYTEGWTVRTLLDFLNQNFHLRDCADSDFKTRKRPCLSWEMGFCPAPCVKKISKKEYQKNVKKALNFLKQGRSESLTKKLKSQMQKHSKDLKFEEAGRLRDRLRAVEMIEQSQSVFQESDKDKDIAVIKTDEENLLIEILHFRKGRLIGSRFQFFKKTKPEEDFLLSFLNQYYSENLIPDELLLKMPIKVSKIKVLEKVLKSRKKSSCRILSVFDQENKKLVAMAEKNANNHFTNEVNKEENVKNLLEEIQRRLKLPKLPLRIECYDISHWKGKQSIGSQVVFEKGQAFKKDYRLYNLKSSCAGDDYMALQEVLYRRLKHKEYKKPDMILIDGGKGQLKAVQKILKDLKQKEIPLVSLAKDRVKEEEISKKSKAQKQNSELVQTKKEASFSKKRKIYNNKTHKAVEKEQPSSTDHIKKNELKESPYKSDIKSSGERFYLPNRKNPVIFPSHSKAGQILLHLRDEAHRFAIQSHRKKRDKMFLKGSLDSIKGLSPKNKTKLLKKFGSLSAIAKLSEKELEDLDFITKPLAKKIKKHFSSKKS